MTVLNLKPKDTQPLQKAVVAFGDAVNDVAAVWCTADLGNNMIESMIGAQDVFEHDGGDNPDHGIWVWEGKIVGIVYPSRPDSAEEYDVEYRGKWRQPTEAEWEKIHCNVNPFEPAPADRKSGQ